MTYARFLWSHRGAFNVFGRISIKGGTGPCLVTYVMPDFGRLFNPPSQDCPLWVWLGCLHVQVKCMHFPAFPDWHAGVMIALVTIFYIMAFKPHCKGFSPCCLEFSYALLFSWRLVNFCISATVRLAFGLMINWKSPFLPLFNLCMLCMLSYLHHRCMSCGFFFSSYMLC